MTTKTKQAAKTTKPVATKTTPKAKTMKTTAMAKQGLWTSPGGATPDATLYASILRNLKKGKDARFAKVERGQFTLAAK